MLKRRDVDLVHAHEFTMSVYGTAAARLLGKPIAITLHSGLYFPSKWRRRVAMRWVCKNAGAVIAVSDITRGQVEDSLGLEPGSVGVVHNGVECLPGDRDIVRTEVGARPDETVVVAVGTVSELKGHIFLLEALDQIGRRRGYEHWRVIIAGQDRGESGRLVEFAMKRGFSDRLHLLGHREDVSNVLAAGDIFAMPSLHEGLPVALLEAMMVGLPVIASGVGGIPEVITSGEEGMLIEKGNSQELAAALDLIMMNPAKRKALARAARGRAQTAFSRDSMVEAYQQLYLRLCGSQSA
jgi:glycosyltransferase involved in cell wall biosynthesis